MIGKLGKNPVKLDPRTLRLASFFNLSVLPAVPASVDWSMRDGVELDYPALGNLTYGDCVFASACHEVETWTGQTVGEQSISDADALDAYTRFTGFDPFDERTDNGAVMLDVAKDWRTKPIARQTLKAFATVDRGNQSLVSAAVDLCGGIWTGWALPLAWQQCVDEWPAGPSTQGQWAPGSWGGHAMAVVAVSPQGLVVRTWGEKRFVTWAGFAAYCEEAYALIGNQLWTTLTGDRCPAGVDGAGLADALVKIAA